MGKEPILKESKGSNWEHAFAMYTKPYFLPKPKPYFQSHISPI